ncbi:MAG TPA: hypothetical protein DEB09_06025 [Candidatus Magasanikbacteria bacterium]|nr:hypothetical protein [Candidatus Magasanikbacteria bacterium]
MYTSGVGKAKPRLDILSVSNVRNISYLYYIHHKHNKANNYTNQDIFPERCIRCWSFWIFRKCYSLVIFLFLFHFFFQYFLPFFVFFFLSFDAFFLQNLRPELFCGFS